MRLGYARGRNLINQLDRLEEFPVDEVFYTDEKEDQEAERERYEEMLDYAERGDTIVITSLEVFSRNYSELIQKVNELAELELDFLVLNLPPLGIDEWKQWLKWTSKNERILYPRLIRMGKEKRRSKDNYSIFSRDREAKALYREVIGQLMAKKKISVIARNQGVPKETVYRIRKEIERIKLAVILVFCFLLAMLSFRLAATYSDSIWLQLATGIIITLVILYNTLVDTDDSA